MKIWGVLGTALLLAGSTSAVTAAAGQERHVARADVLRLGPGGGRLGVRVEEVRADEAKTLGLERPRGARVVDVSEDSPADDAGVRSGDVILELDGEAVRGVAHLVRLVHETPPGREVAIRLAREDERVEVRAVIGEGGVPGLMEGIPLPEALDLPDVRVPRFHFEGPDAGELRSFTWRFPGPRLGLRYQELDGQLADYFGLERDRGLLVVHVDPDTPAARAGLQAGDVLLEVDGRSIEDAPDLHRAVRELEEGTPAAVRVLRRGEEKTLEVIPEPGRERVRRGERL